MRPTESIPPGRASGRGRRKVWRSVVALAAVAGCSVGVDAAGVDARSIVHAGIAPAVPACGTCHGAAGEGNPAAAFPRLAGLGSGYLGAQLEAFASGSRANPVMAPIAKALSGEQRRAVAAYYAALPSSFARVGVDEAEVQPTHVGAWLANRGRWNDGLPACVACHGSGGAGVSPAFPPLAGQSAAYLAAQLNDWKAGKRGPGPQALMAHVAAKLSASDIENVSQYFGSLRPAGAAQKQGHPK